jgi:hypothetical protein
LSSGIYKNFLEKLSQLPTWLKLTAYSKLKRDLELYFTKNCLDSFEKEEFFPLYIPNLTAIGKNEVQAKSENFSLNIYNFLENCTQDLNIIEISLKNDWCLAEISNYFISCIDFELIEQPSSPQVMNTALYLCDFIRMGEYFVSLGKINIDQLDEALRTQKYITEATNEHMGLGEILINLGALTKIDIDGISFLKEKSNKKMNLNSLDEFFKKNSLLND